MGYVGVKPSAVPLTSADITDGIITSAKIADGTIVNADINASAAIVATKLTGISSQPFRNIVINGDMQVAQRNTSKSSISTGSDYHTLDRFRTLINSLGTWTQSQSTDVPTGEGFANSLKMDCTTADASPSAGDYLIIRQMFEGQNLQYLKKGTANAVSLTLSFWVKSTKTGTFICEFEDTDNSRLISKSYTVNTTNTWEKKTITFEGDTTGAFTNDNGLSLVLNFWLGAGTDFTSGTLATTWGASTTANRVVGQVNIADSTSNDWYITGVQLEAGTSATDFEFLPIDVNLGRCQRYYQLIAKGGTSYISVAYQYNSTQAMGFIDIPTMRTTPSISATSGTDYYQFYRNNAGDGFNSFLLDSYSTTRIVSILNNSEVSGTGGQAGSFATHNASSFVAVDSEL
jgi:hypothetical protein